MLLFNTLSDMIPLAVFGMIMGIIGIIGTIFWIVGCFIIASRTMDSATKGITLALAVFIFLSTVSNAIVPGMIMDKATDSIGAIKTYSTILLILSLILHIAFYVKVISAKGFTTKLAMISCVLYLISILLGRLLGIFIQDISIIYFSIASVIFTAAGGVLIFMFSTSAPKYNEYNKGADENYNKIS